MNIKELRIGNIVHWGDHWTKVDINILWNFSTYLSGGISEEPITEEWLIDSGFIFKKCGQDVNSGKYCHWDYWVLNGFMLRGLNGKFGFQGDVKNIDIRSVHQLQNLYFTLQAEELPI
jgi:hypothetical protein